MKYPGLIDDARAELDELDEMQRVILCCMYETSDRATLARLIADDTEEAIDGELVSRGKRGREAVAQLIEVHLQIHIDTIEGNYWEGVTP